MPRPIQKKASLPDLSSEITDTAPPLPASEPSELQWISYNPDNHRGKSRRRTSPEQLVQLEAAFQSDSKPTSEFRKDLAARLGMTVREVQIWFQNRRAKSRQKQKQALGLTSSPAGPAGAREFGMVSFASSPIMRGGAAAASGAAAIPGTSTFLLPSSPQTPNPAHRSQIDHYNYTFDLSLPVPSPPSTRPSLPTTAVTTSTTPSPKHPKDNTFHTVSASASAAAMAAVMGGIIPLSPASTQASFPRPQSKGLSPITASTTTGAAAAAASPPTAYLRPQSKGVVIDLTHAEESKVVVNTVSQNAGGGGGAAMRSRTPSPCKRPLQPLPISTPQRTTNASPVVPRTNRPSTTARRTHSPSPPHTKMVSATTTTTKHPSPPTTPTHANHTVLIATGVSGRTRDKVPRTVLRHAARKPASLTALLVRVESEGRVGGGDVAGEGKLVVSNVDGGEGKVRGKRKRGRPVTKGLGGSSAASTRTTTTRENKPRRVVRKEFSVRTGSDDDEEGEEEEGQRTPGMVVGTSDEILSPEEGRPEVRLSLALSDDDDCDEGVVGGGGGKVEWMSSSPVGGGVWREQGSDEDDEEEGEDEVEGDGGHDDGTESGDEKLMQEEEEESDQYTDTHPPPPITLDFLNMDPSFFLSSEIDLPADDDVHLPATSAPFLFVADADAAHVEHVIEPGLLGPMISGVDAGVVASTPGRRKRKRSRSRSGGSGDVTPSKRSRVMGGGSSNPAVVILPPKEGTPGRDVEWLYETFGSVVGGRHPHQIQLQHGSFVVADGEVGEDGEGPSPFRVSVGSERMLVSPVKRKSPVRGGGGAAQVLFGSPGGSASPSKRIRGMNLSPVKRISLSPLKRSPMKVGGVTTPGEFAFGLEFLASGSGVNVSPVRNGVGEFDPLGGFWSGGDGSAGGGGLVGGGSSPVSGIMDVVGASGSAFGFWGVGGGSPVRGGGGGMIGVEEGEGDVDMDLRVAGFDGEGGAAALGSGSGGRGSGWKRSEREFAVGKVNLGTSEFVDMTEELHKRMRERGVVEPGKGEKGKGKRGGRKRK
ncbi:hypothetical protein HDV00_012837 [Rhizophlyctis rosea]|nr:hypothetical protein HDV00_012837 [Rhizophlyctis rosea]